VTLVDLPSRTDVDERWLGSGRGGDGSDGWGDDYGDGWGWSEEPFGEDDLPYRRPRIIRALAIVLALVVVTGSVGAYVAVVTVGSGGQFSVSGVSATVSRGTTSAPLAEVTFVVSNESTEAGQARCTARVETAQAVVGSAAAQTGRLRAGGSLRFDVRVPLSSSELSGATAAVEVGCVPVRDRAT